MTKYLCSVCLSYHDGWPGLQDLIRPDDETDETTDHTMEGNDNG